MIRIISHFQYLLFNTHFTGGFRRPTGRLSLSFISLKHAEDSKTKLVNPETGYFKTVRVCDVCYRHKDSAEFYKHFCTSTSGQFQYDICFVTCCFETHIHTGCQCIRQYIASTSNHIVSYTRKNNNSRRNVHPD